MSLAITIENAKKASADSSPPHWVEDLRALVSPGRVFADFDTRLDHSRDRLPFGRFCHRSKRLTGTLPSVVVEPVSIAELQQVVTFATARNLSLIPYGSGSGVLGGTVPFDGEMIVATNRMSRVIEIDETNCIVRVEAGTNGRALEMALRERGFTCGHYPQSMDMSTVGGWVACRGSGQASSRYGNIENIVVGMKVVLPNGELLHVRHAPRRSVGPSLIELFIGSEGALGFIAEITMRIWRLPEIEINGAVAFPSIEAGLDGVREIMQAEIRPSLIRLYDKGESERWGQTDLPAGDARILCMLVFSGSRAVAEAEAETAFEICAKHGAEVLNDQPLRRWQKVRFESHSDEFVNAGGFYDTIEIAAPWSALSNMYTRIRSAVADKYPIVQLNAHWSHAYSDGACMYMTAKFPAMADAEALPMHSDIWDIVMSLCLELGGTISHHHGIGYFRNKWIGAELNSGHKLLAELKRSLDPGLLFNPGKLGLTPDA